MLSAQQVTYYTFFDNLGLPASVQTISGFFPSYKANIFFEPSSPSEMLKSRSYNPRPAPLQPLAGPSNTPGGRPPYNPLTTPPPPYIPTLPSTTNMSLPVPYFQCVRVPADKPPELSGGPEQDSPVPGRPHHDALDSAVYQTGGRYLDYSCGQ